MELQNYLRTKDLQSLCNEFNIKEVADLFAEEGYGNVKVIMDMQGKERVLVAVK